jgi:hypothetical protein
LGRDRRISDSPPSRILRTCRKSEVRGIINLEEI